MRRITALTLAFLIILSMCGCTQSSEKPVVIQPPANTVVLKDYEDVYAEQGLLGAIRYFGEHTNEYSQDAKKDFAREVAHEVNKRGLLYEQLNHAIEPVSSQAPPLVDFVDTIYDGIYLLETNAVNLARISDTAAVEAFEKIAEDDVFVFAKAYWVEDGHLEDAGFKVVVHPNVYSVMKECLELTFRRLEGTEDYASSDGSRLPGLEAFAKPTEVIREDNTAWDSQEKYPKVYLESFDKHVLLLDAWKAEAYLPVNYINELSLGPNTPQHQLSVLMSGDQIIALLGEGYTFETSIDGGYFQYYSTLAYDGIEFRYYHDSELPVTANPPDAVTVLSNQYRYDFDVLVGGSALDALTYCDEHFEKFVSRHQDGTIFDIFHYTECDIAGKAVDTGYLLAFEYSTGESYSSKSEIETSVRVKAIHLINAGIVD